MGSKPGLQHNYVPWDWEHFHSYSWEPNSEQENVGPARTVAKAFPTSTRHFTQERTGNSVATLAGIHRRIATENWRQTQMTILSFKEVVRASQSKTTQKFKTQHDGHDLFKSTWLPIHQWAPQTMVGHHPTHKANCHPCQMLESPHHIHMHGFYWEPLQNFAQLGRFANKKQTDDSRSSLNKASSPTPGCIDSSNSQQANIATSKHSTSKGSGLVRTQRRGQRHNYETHHSANTAAQALQDLLVAHSSCSTICAAVSWYILMFPYTYI